MVSPDNDATMLICNYEAFSLCGCTKEQYSCGCTPRINGNACAGCGRLLLLVDCGTGEPVERAS